ncbi:hypothetical protein B7494_g7715 [Chlorociboria aeruginascens]|nr:hypothetical protein B7494_g7715 [Chlorociboria aeruginascens]
MVKGLGAFIFQYFLLNLWKKRSEKKGKERKQNVLWKKFEELKNDNFYIHPKPRQIRTNVAKKSHRPNLSKCQHHALSDNYLVIHALFLYKPTLRSFLIEIMTSKPPPEPIKSSVISNDPAKTFYDPNTPWTNYWNIITGRMTSAGQIAFREDASIRNEKRDCNACEEWRDYLFKYSPMIVFMQKNIRELNGDLGPDNVICRRCPAELQNDGTLEYKVGGGFNPDRGIMICANQMRDRKHLEDTLAHEMIHAWDHLRWNINYNNLRHMAYSSSDFEWRV